MNVLAEDTRVDIDARSLAQIGALGGPALARALAPNVNTGNGLANAGVDAIANAGKVGVARGQLLRETRERVAREQTALVDRVVATVEGVVAGSSPLPTTSSSPL